MSLLANNFLKTLLAASLLSTAALAKDPPSPAAAPEDRVSLGGLTLEPEAPRLDSAVRLSVQITNKTDKPLGGLQLILQVDGKKVVERRLFERLRANGETTVSLSWVPKLAGSHHLDLLVESGELQAGAIHKDIRVDDRIGYRLEVIKVAVPPQARAGHEVAAKVDFQNTGDAPADEIRVFLVSDGHRLLNVRAHQSLSPTGKASVVLRWAPEQVGKHDYSVELEAAGFVKQSGLTAGPTAPHAHSRPKSEAPAASTFSLEVVGQ